MEYLLLPSDPYRHLPMFPESEPKKIIVKYLGIKKFVYVKFNKAIDLANAAAYAGLTIKKIGAKQWNRQQQLSKRLVALRSLLKLTALNFQLQKKISSSQKTLKK